MQSSARDSYLETEVTTATPQKQQLMLIEGTIRFIGRTRSHWRAGQDERAHECLVRAQQIVTELLAGLNHEVAPELTRRVAALYVFVFRSLVDAGLRRDEAKLDEALRVLEPQREAWHGVCQELKAESRQPKAESGEPLSAVGFPPSAFIESTGFSMEV